MGPVPKKGMVAMTVEMMRALRKRIFLESI
jgi:hypothetical protein